MVSLTINDLFSYGFQWFIITTFKSIAFVLWINNLTAEFLFHSFLLLKSESYKPIWNPKFWIASTDQEIYTLVGKYTIIGVSKTPVKKTGGNLTFCETVRSNFLFEKLKGSHPFLGAVGKKIEVTRGSGEHPGWKMARRGEPEATNVRNSFTMKKKLDVIMKVIQKRTVTFAEHTFVNRGILVYECRCNGGHISVSRRVFLFINDEGHLVILYKVLVNGIGWLTETVAQRD